MASKKQDVLDRFLTRREAMHLLTNYHRQYHTPWYVRLWKLVTGK